MYRELLMAVTATETSIPGVESDFESEQVRVSLAGQAFRKILETRSSE